MGDVFNRMELGSKGNRKGQLKACYIKRTAILTSLVLVHILVIFVACDIMSDMIQDQREVIQFQTSTSAVEGIMLAMNNKL